MKPTKRQISHKKNVCTSTYNGLQHEERLRKSYNNLQERLVMNTLRPFSLAGPTGIGSGYSTGSNCLVFHINSIYRVEVGERERERVF